MIVSIHQPNFMPGANYFYKLARSDIFILYDDCQYTHGGYTNRTKIRVNYGEGWDWLTIPIKKHPLDTPINEIAIDNSQEWKHKHLAIISEHYRKANNFEPVFSTLEKLYDVQHASLMAFNIDLIFMFCQFFKINPKITFSSNLKVGGYGSQKISDLCLKVGARYYLSGPGGSHYLDLEDFRDRNIQVAFIQGKHKEYKQIYSPFIEGLSELDFLMNEAKL